MKEILLSRAKENGHYMTRVSPERYECSGCQAVIEVDPDKPSTWRNSKIGNLCPEALVVPVRSAVKPV